MVEKERPDVLLLDIMMPHVSGLDILAALRADKRWAHLPVVILTAATDSGALSGCALELGATRLSGQAGRPDRTHPRVSTTC